MPNVSWELTPGIIEERMLQSLGRAFQEIVAAVMDGGTPATRLSREDIAVLVRFYGPHDLHASDFGLVITINLPPERLWNLQERVERIAAHVRDLAPIPRELVGVKRAFVWCPNTHCEGFSFL